jgi:hypothetical protein
MHDRHVAVTRKGNREQRRLSFHMARRMVRKNWTIRSWLSGLARKKWMPS